MRILSWLNARHWQPCRELKELFDDTVDHIPERSSALILTNEKVMILTEYGLRRWEVPSYRVIR